MKRTFRIKKIPFCERVKIYHEYLKANQAIQTIADKFNVSSQSVYKIVQDAFKFRKKQEQKTDEMSIRINPYFLDLPFQLFK